MMKANQWELPEEQKGRTLKVVRDPLRFAKHFLGVELWKSQMESLNSIKTKRRTAIKSCHASGKTFVLAVSALWWLARYRDGIVIMISATERQVRTQLWNEVRRIVAKAKVPYPPVKSTELKLRDDNNFAIGFSTNQAENFQGYHGRHVLIIADEAPGIESGIFDAIAGTMAGGNVRIVLAGNPTVPSGAFFDAFTKERGLWNCITIDAFDCPNLKGMKLEELLQLDPTEGGPLDQNPIPYLVTKRWVYEQYLAWWHGSESSSPIWMSRVRAEFPDQAQNALIKMAWLERAKRHPLQNPVDTRAVPLFAGVDVGGGEAETVVYVCESTYDRRGIIAMDAWRGEDTRGRVVNFLDQFRTRLTLVRVDAIGIGHNFGLHLRDCRFPVELVNVGMPCESNPERGENDPARRFVNLRASFYQALADAFERDQMEGLTDETTIGQLAGLLYELDSQGRMKIESKEKARERGVPSPDRADALMLALCKSYQKIEFYSVRDLRQRESKSSEIASRANHPFFGFTDLGDDHGDDEKRDPWAGWVGKLRWPSRRGGW